MTKKTAKTVKKAKAGDEQKVDAATEAGPESEEQAEPAVEKAPDAETEALNIRFLRLQADFENFRKRTLREKSELYQRANEDLMVEMLSVLDHLDLALEAGNQDKAAQAVCEGIRLVRDQLVATLGKFGLKAIDAEGETFDPHQHEAVLHMPSDAVPENGVINQTRRGYTLGRKVLRAAQVVVSSGAPQVEAEGDDAVPSSENSEA